MKSNHIPDDLTPERIARHLYDDVISALGYPVIEGLHLNPDHQRHYEAKALLYRLACVMYVLLQAASARPKLNLVREELEKIVYPEDNREGRRRLKGVKLALIKIHDLVETIEAQNIPHQWGMNWLKEIGRKEENIGTMVLVAQAWRYFLDDCQTEVFVLESHL